MCSLLLYSVHPKYCTLTNRVVGEQEQTTVIPRVESYSFFLTDKSSKSENLFILISFEFFWFPLLITYSEKHSILWKRTDFRLLSQVFIHFSRFHYIGKKLFFSNKGFQCFIHVVIACGFYYNTSVDNFPCYYYFKIFTC